jgi:hypothetical protein
MSLDERKHRDYKSEEGPSVAISVSDISYSNRKGPHCFVTVSETIQLRFIYAYRSGRFSLFTSFIWSFPELLLDRPWFRRLRRPDLFDTLRHSHPIRFQSPDSILHIDLFAIYLRAREFK